MIPAEVQLAICRRVKAREVTVPVWLEGGLVKVRRAGEIEPVLVSQAEAYELAGLPAPAPRKPMGRAGLPAPAKARARR